MMCPICRCKDLSFFAAINGWKIFQCENCKHQFLPEPADYKKIYSDDYFFHGESGYSDYLDNADQLIIQGHWYANLLNKYMKPGYMLDVGAASGHILKGFVDKGWNGIGIEPNKNMVVELRRWKYGTFSGPAF